MRTRPRERSLETHQTSRRRERGQALVEFALLLPVLLAVLFLVVDFGVGISRWVVVTNAAREAARLGASGEDSITAIQQKAVQSSAGLLEEADVTVTYRDIGDNNSEADRGDSVKVKAAYEYGLITPLRALLDLGFDSITLEGCADMRLEVPLPGVATVSANGC